jgi:hypothetical protein
MSNTLVLGSAQREPFSMKLQRAICLVVALMTIPPLLHVCGDDPRPTAEEPPRPDAGAPPPDAGVNGDPLVFFDAPRDGSSMRSPVHVVLGAENFVIEKAEGQETVTRGHFHVMIDVECLHNGELMEPDAQHLDLANGENEVLIELTPGPHELCVQAATGDHHALDLVAHIHINVLP